MSLLEPDARTRAETKLVEAAPLSLTELADSFVARAEARELRVGVIGLGYVGLPLAEAFLRKGYPVRGFDVDASKISALAAGKPYIKHIGLERMAFMRDSERFSATTDFSNLRELDAILICVPTPLNRNREPDLSFVTSTTRALAEHLQSGQLVVLESTTYPGTTEEVMVPILEKSGLKAGQDFAIAYSPEREDPGNANFETSTIPKVVGAPSPDELRMGVALYSGIVAQVVPVKDARTAEAVKLTENIFRAVNIALVNELKVVYQEMGIDVWEVINAAKTKPFGFMAFYPGPGLGGHCIPIDPFYLTWKAREFGLSTRFIELAGEINTRMPHHVIEKTAAALNDRLGKALRGARVLVIGLAYKRNVDDMRESPSIELIEQFERRGARVDYYDPHIPVAPSVREHPGIAGRRSVAWTPETLRNFDVALIATDHDGIDYAPLIEYVPLIIDTRNALAEFGTGQGSKIVKA
jgi:UDP-N-acetyl-D-glucosamine dehydrogenase